MAAKPAGNPFWQLLQQYRRYRGRVLWASFASVVNKLLDLAPPILIGAAVDVVVLRENSFLGQLGIADPVTQLVLLVVASIVIWAFESLFEYLYAVAWRNLAQTLQHELRIESYAHVQGLEQAYFEDRSTGGLMSILNDDVNQLERFLDGGANEVLQVVTTVIAVGVLFVALAPSVAWISMLPMPIVIWGSLWFQGYLAPRYASVREKVGILNGHLANNLGGITTIKSYTAEAHEIARISTASEDYRQSNQQAIRLSSAFSPLIRMVIVVGFVVVLGLGGVLVLQGQLNAGAYSVMVFMIQRLLWPLTRLGQTFDLYQRAMASVARILDLLNTPPQIVSGLVTLPKAEVRGAVAFEQVQFAYANRQPVLRDLSLRVAPGETVGIVGATGAGKTTVVKLLLRLYDVTGGRLTLDGHDIRELRLDDLRRAVGLVSQDVFLFDGTVRDNIAYGTFDATDAEVIAAATVAEAHDFIMSLPQGYATIVGERGQKLSGGQRQRISIARAILKDPPVLVLDEATSSVDNETEAAIQRSLAQITVGRTTIVIAHRLSTVRHADRILVLSHGRLVEEGHHEDLLARDGVYAALWKVQTGEAVPAAGPVEVFGD